MSVLPSHPLLKVTSSCALPAGGLVNLSHIPAPQLRLSLIAPRIPKPSRTRLCQRLVRDRIDVAVSAVAPVAALGTSRALRSAPFVPPRKAEEAAGAKLEVVVKAPRKTISVIAPPARRAFSTERAIFCGGGVVGSLFFSKALVFCQQSRLTCAPFSASPSSRLPSCRLASSWGRWCVEN